MYLSLLNTNNSLIGWIIFFACGYLGSILIGLGNYIQPLSMSFILGCVAMSLTFSRQYNIKRSLIFIGWSSLFLVIYCFIPAKTLLFIAVVSSIFATLQLFGVSPDYRTLISLLVMSPMAAYVFGLFGFPIRLFLTSVAGSILKIIHPETEIEGNIIVTKISAFSVDPACMGLYMMISSTLAGIMLTCILEKKEGKNISTKGFLLCLFVVFALNVVSNLLRILFLVNFNIGPGHIMHEVIGIACFMVYVILPTLFFIRFYLRRFGIHRKQAAQVSGHPPAIVILVNAMLLIIILLASINAKNRTVNGRMVIKTPVVPGYNTVQLADRVIKMENQRALIYIKPIVGFYSTDHQPMICWSGSGYDFKDIKEGRMAGRNVYHAMLQTKKDTLYTAWWYDSGRSTTLSQWQWRWNSFSKGEKFCLVNVTASTPERLEEEVRNFSTSLNLASVFAP